MVSQDRVSHRVFKGMATLLVGAGLARIVGLVSIPILARIYAPDDYGVLALYISFIALLAPLMTLRYVQAIPLPRKDLAAFNLFVLCFKLIVVSSLLLAILLALIGETLLAWFDMEVLMPWRWLIVLGAAGTALYELFSLWATRKKQYKTIAKTQFSQSLIGNFVKIGLGMLAFKPAGLIVGQFLSQTMGVGSFIKNSRSDFKMYLPLTRFKTQKFLARYYQEFAWFRLPSQLLMILSVQAPIMMMAALYDKEMTGQLSLAMLALSLPVGLVGSAMAKAYYAEIAALGRNNLKKITKLTFIVQKNLLLVGIPFALIIFFFSEFAFKLIFGAEWATAGVFASILAPFVLFQFTSSPLMEVINILGTQIVYLILHSLRIAGLVGIFLYAGYFHIEVDSFVVILSVYLSAFYLLASMLVLALLIKTSNRLE